MTKTLKIEGMSCEHCSNKVKGALEEISGVTRVEVALEAQTADVELDAEVGQDVLAAAVDKAGYTFAGVR